MKTKALSILLPLLLALTACGAGISAAGAGAVEPSGQRETVTLSAETDGFSDVPAGANYAQAAAWCYEKGLMNGVGDGRFDPDGFMTRAMLAAILYRQAGEPSGSPAFPARRYSLLPSSIPAASMPTRNRPSRTRWTSWTSATST